MRVYQNKLGIGPGHPLYDYIVSIEERAHYAAEQMYDVSRYAQSTNAKIANWCRTAIMCANLDPIAQPELYSEHHDILVRKMYMQYGYAVEEYVNIEINSGALQPPCGYRISSQESHGSTRPDYVIRRSAGVERDDFQVWLDLTSQKSSRHILKKAGAGWRSKSFVAELFYSPLILSNISMAGNYSIAQRAQLNSAIRRQEMRQRQLTEYMVCCVDKALGKLYSILKRRTGSAQNAISIAQIALIFEKEFKQSLVSIYNHQQIVKGILVEYMAASRTCYHNTVRYILFGFYSSISSKKADAMRYVRDSYVGNNIYVTGEELEQQCAEL